MSVHAFDKSQTEFPSQVHQYIHEFALKRTPLRVSLSDTSDYGSEVVESCRSYFDFVEEMLSDMYENPEVYQFQPGVLEDFLGGRNLTLAKRQQPKEFKKVYDKVKKETTVPKYLNYLRWIGACCELADGCAKISSQVLDHYVMTSRNIGGPSKSREANKEFWAKMEALNRVGFRLEEQDDVVLFYSDHHPEMFRALQLMARNCEQIEVFGELQFYACDFRVIFSHHVPEYEDVVRPLDNTKRAFIEQIHQFLLENNCKPSCKTFWKVNYAYKSKHLFYLETNGNFYDIRLTGLYAHEDENLLIRALEDIDDSAFEKFVLRSLNYCKACGTCKPGIGRFVQIYNKKKRLCVGLNFHLLKSTAEDLDNIKRLILIKLQLQNELAHKK